MLGVLVLLVAVLGSLLGATGSAYAVAGPSTAKATATASATAAKAATRTAPKPAAKTATPKPVTKPVAPTRAEAPGSSPTTAARTLRAAAFRTAFARPEVPDTCSGPLVADTVYPCDTPSGTGTDSYTLTLPDASDVLFVRATSSTGNALGVTVTAPDSSAVNCQEENWNLPDSCPTTQAGGYTVQVQNDGAAYTLAYSALLSDTSCGTADPSFAAPTLQGTAAAGSVGNCYTLAMTSGQVLDVNLSSDPYQQLGVIVYDSTGAQICQDDQGDCTLTGTGPYRVLATGFYGTATSYNLRLNSVSQPQGCLADAQQTYGTAPDASSTVRCRTLDVAAAGEYQIYATSPTDGSVSGTLYHPDGTAACANSGPFCQLTPGGYNFVADVYPTDNPTLAVVFIAADESRGCTATGDTDFASGAATGTFAGTGEELCLNLPTASGASDYIFNQPTTSPSQAQIQILDATGAQQCPSADFDYAVCQLTGTAPFRVILSGQAQGGDYTVLVQRTDSAAGCADWPQSGFGSSWGATVSVTPTSTVRCLSIPANQHSTGEMIDYSNLANRADGNITVYTPTGGEVCTGASTGICAFQPGVAYTALLANSENTADTYDLVRRDVSATAACSKPTSTAPGGPSTGLVLNSDLDTACIRIPAAAADDVWADVRATAPAPAGAVLQVTNAAGQEVCRQWGASCQLSGSTAYQLIVTASDYSGIAIAAHVDSWIVGTASGWAPQCTAHQLSVNGFGLTSGTFTETSTGYCGVLTLRPVQPWDQFSVYGTADGAGVNVPWVSMYTAANWSGSQIMCGGNNVGVFSYTCQSPSLTQATQAVLLVTPYEAPTPISYTMQGVCQEGCASPPPVATITSVSPASGPVNTANRAVVTGTQLTLGTALTVGSDGTQAQGTWVSPVSVNSGGTSLTVQIEGYDVTPGTYDLIVNGNDELPGAYTFTAATPAPQGRFVPITPDRILDTRSGKGAPKARVAPGGTVRLQVAGADGIPTSGVTAVSMNVTAVSPSSGGFVSVYPDGQTRPGVSNLNFTAGETIPNLVTVPVVNGKVDLYNGSGGTVDLLADVNGYYTSGSGEGSLLTPVGPTRILDTRSGTGAPKAKVAPGGTVRLQVAGAGGIPTSGATAVVMNVTAVSPSSGGFVSVYADGQTRPGVSNLNFTAGETIPNLVTVPVVNGRVDLYNGSGGTVDLLADITGYFSDGSGGSLFQAVTPDRVLDTRSGTGGAGGPVVSHGAAALNVSAFPGLPSTVTAVVLNVTVTGPQQGGFLSVYPDGQALPDVSNLNYGAGETIANQVIVPVVDGVVDFYNGSYGDDQVVADLDGYYLT
jgi:hypothetical protein